MINVKNLSTKELKDLATKIRERIVSVVSKNGGHLSSPLGAVELIIAMHYVFDAKKDAFIFDVSHQAYAHKLLTDRWDEFDSLREFNGISGFTNPNESKYDYFVAGHSSTALSLGVGVCKASVINKSDKKAICLIGDGSMSAGMMYEALNELGDKSYPLIFILNDNEMSISKPIGAISRYLSQLLAGNCYQGVKKWINEKTKDMPTSIGYLTKKFDKWLKLITPGIIFEELGLDYIGPIDGHDIESLIKSLELAKKINKSVVIHTQTVKGKGYKYAEKCDGSWHGVGPFEIKSGKNITKNKVKNITTIFSDYLLKMATKHKNIVGVTAAMPSGTGLSKLISKMPNRFFDVGIAEQHAISSFASMAKEGFKPFIAIYSTFLQRAYDQIIHDVCIMSLPVVFIIDRAGIVGADGETHQGTFDIAFLRVIPNIILLAPRDNQSLENAMDFAYICDKPCAIRFPRGNFILPNNHFLNEDFKVAKAQMLINNNSNISLIGYGNGVGKAYEVSLLLKDKVNIIDIKFIKPIDKEFLKELSKTSKKWFIFSDNAKISGVASTILETLSSLEIINILVKSFEYDDNFIPHGDTKLVEKSLGLDSNSISIKIIDSLGV
jgi:1-deoxy-D-xylulose-5-phosphate synthase